MKGVKDDKSLWKHKAIAHLCVVLVLSSSLWVRLGPTFHTPTVFTRKVKANEPLRSSHSPSVLPKRYSDRILWNNNLNLESNSWFYTRSYKQEEHEKKIMILLSLKIQELSLPWPGTDVKSLYAFGARDIASERGVSGRDWCPWLQVSISCFQSWWLGSATGNSSEQQQSCVVRESSEHLIFMMRVYSSM